MHYDRHRENGSGFMAVAEPSDRLPIQQAGEVWAPAERSIRMHTNAGWELYFQSKGESWWEIGGERVHVPENGAYLIREGTPHRLRRFSRGCVHFFWAVFPPASVPAIVRKESCWQKAHTVLGWAHEVLNPLQGLMREVSIKEPWQSAACRCYVDALCVVFTRLAENYRAEKPLSRHPCAERAQRLLGSRLEHPWRLDELARLSGVSLQHLIAIFRQEYGRTPMRALKQMRLEEACRRLRQTEQSVTEIALELGFSSSQHLANACRNTFGATPTELRKK